MSITYYQEQASKDPNWVSLQDAVRRTGIPRETLQAQCRRGYYEKHARRVPSRSRTGQSWRLSLDCPIFKKEERVSKLTEDQAVEIYKNVTGVTVDPSVFHSDYQSPAQVLWDKLTDAVKKTQDILGQLKFDGMKDEDHLFPDGGK